MYFTREEQIAPEPLQASRNESVQTSTTEEATNDYGLPLISSLFSGAKVLASDFLHRSDVCG